MRRTYRAVFAGWTMLVYAANAVQHHLPASITALHMTEISFIQTEDPTYDNFCTSVTTLMKVSDPE
jgi:hypothetical protein